MNYATQAPEKSDWQPSPPLHLAEERSAKNITIDDVATATRINPQYLRAIEAEDFAQLPGGIYAVSYIRQYAAAIGCDEANVLARYRSGLVVRELPELVLQASCAPASRRKS